VKSCSTVTMMLNLGVYC